jgi:hypothetical protein
LVVPGAASCARPVADAITHPMIRTMPIVFIVSLPAAEVSAANAQLSRPVQYWGIISERS